jgi:hypothetical protein
MVILRGFERVAWSQGLGRPLELIEQGVMLRLEAAPLGIREAGRRQLEAFEVEERHADTLDARLEPCGEGAEGRGPVGLRTDGRDGVAEKRTALALGAGCTPGGDERQRLALFEAMAEHGIEQCLLGIVAEGAQGIGERQTDLPLVELVLRGATQAGREGVTPHDPGFATAEQTRDGGERETVVADERGDDPRLVHRRDGPRWRVGAQQQGLALGPGSSVLNDGGDRGRTGADPAGEPLKAVDDFEGPVVLRDDPQRQLGEGLVRRHPRDAGAKTRPARTQALDRQAEHRAGIGRRAGSRTGPWNRCFRGRRGNRSKNGRHHTDR